MKKATHDIQAERCADAVKKPTQRYVHDPEKRAAVRSPWQNNVRGCAQKSTQTFLVV